VINDYGHKIQYVQAYIHYMKGSHIQIRLPQSQREQHLLNHAYVIAKNKMNKMGKEINI